MTRMGVSCVVIVSQYISSYRAFLKCDGVLRLCDTGGSGVGSFSVMGNSWGFDGSQNYPPEPDPFNLIQWGWVVPNEIKQSGSNYALKVADTKPVPGDVQLYKISVGYRTGEYFLFQYRRFRGPETTSEDCPSTNFCQGVVIYHIDELSGYSTEGYPGQFEWPTNGQHYNVAVMQRDGQYDLEKRNNRGHADDFYKAGNSIGTAGYPNTDGYQGGKIRRTGITISVQSGSSPDYMNLSVVMPFLANLKVTLKTDNNPGQTTWRVKDSVGGIMAERTSFTSKLTTYVDTVSLIVGRYTVEVTDSKSNGICCASGAGSFTAEMNGRVLMSVGAFGASASVPFAVATPSPTRFPTTAPTKSPTAVPTKAPTLMPTPTKAPTPVPTKVPTAAPTRVPTRSPTRAPTRKPSRAPTRVPTRAPTNAPK
jgi:hypothetical protein